MIYNSSSHWHGAQHKRVMLFGMSGLGKTHVSSLLRGSGNWFHYSVDYRIGTHYMGEHIVDNFKSCAMKDPFLADLLRSDSIYIASNITFDNLSPLSTYLGKPGSIEHGGLPFDEYQKRQNQHIMAEKSALIDTLSFIEKGTHIYGYDNFICDSGGSICEVVEPSNINDEILKKLSRKLLFIWIKGSNQHRKNLIDRFDKNPKPMCYQPEFLIKSWSQYKQEKLLTVDKINPDSFIRWIYSKALDYRPVSYTHLTLPTILLV